MISGLLVSLGVAALATGPWIADMRRTGLSRQNFRDREVAFPAGAVLVACSLIALAPLAVLNDRANLDLLDPELGRWAVFVLGVALLGLIDDALGRGAAADTPRGWRGHANAVLSGRFSTGFIKAVGALALAAFATSGRGRHDLGYVVDLLLLLLATNLFNLLDLRPGRVEKALALLLAGLCVGAWTAAPIDILGVFLGPVAVMAVFTLARAGDARRHGLEPGRSARAASRWWWCSARTGRAIALAVVLALTIFGEFRSISAAIDRVPLLRSLDSLGRSE